MPLENSISQIPVEVFVAYIVEKLRKDNPRMRYAVSEKQYELGGAVVQYTSSKKKPRFGEKQKDIPGCSDSTWRLSYNLSS